MVAGIYCQKIAHKKYVEIICNFSNNCLWLTSSCLPHMKSNKTEFIFQIIPSGIGNTEAGSAYFDNSNVLEFALFCYIFFIPVRFQVCFFVVPKVYTKVFYATWPFNSKKNYHFPACPCLPQSTYLHISSNWALYGMFSKIIKNSDCCTVFIFVV